MTSQTHEGHVHASVGDQVIIHSRHLGEPVREGEILEIRHEDGSPPYLVRWSDTGHVSLLFPGPDATIKHFEHDAAAESPAGSAPYKQ